MLEPTSHDWPEPNDEAILSEAARWICKVNGCGLTGREREQLKAWLMLDARHASALDLTMEAWDKSPERFGGLGYEGTTAASNSGSSRFGWALGGLVSAAAAVLVFFLMLPPAEPAFTHALAGASARSITLADGSDVNLLPDSEISYTISEGRREVRLLSGAARFEVQSANAVFVVEAGDVDLTVTGTEFTVMRGEGTTEIELHEGQVELSVFDQYQATLNAGNRAIYDRRSRRLDVMRKPAKTGLGQGIGATNGAPSSDDKPAYGAVGNATKQTPPSLSFASQRLDDVLAEIESASGLSVSLASTEIADTQISGRVSLDEPVSDLEAILSAHGLVVIRAGSRLSIDREE